MDIEEALVVIDTALENFFLSNLQELILRQSWEGKTYPEIAESYGYEANYIKNVGYKLWGLLSQAFAEEVTKSNFRSAIRRQSTHVLTSHAESETNNTCQSDQNTTNTLKSIKSFQPKLVQYNTDDSSTSNQHLVAINIAKQCGECLLIELFESVKNCQEFKLKLQANLIYQRAARCPRRH
ncbi:hypothetical protein [Gloeocapsopsis dulcis]|uniref:hypothetical protein n=1 Tax=Gloeocapsopsis dulcis TaxID=2859516 RepID=UPI0018C80AE3|nr:hypothetical protein [Gloeocapsopsis dulcis]WNN88235.1 hypothetical protein P0S91_18335 [Gloeocapsopsis dulcis]